MYARLVQITLKPGQLGEANRILRERLLPLLRQQEGFVDGISLVSDTERDQTIGISLWKSREDCDRYVATQVPKIMESIKNLLQSEPIARTFNVDVSTSHGIGLGLAASST
jgi:quinol monooxygenase YgiN